MTYDPGGAYVPPRRAYYNQSQQQAPMQNGYGYGNQGQAQHNDYYAQQPYEQGYQGYDQQYSQSSGYDMGGGGQNGQYGDQYYGSQQNAMQHPPRQPNGYGAPQQRTDRQYDPRYQQRPDKGKPSNQDQRKQERGRLQKPDRSREQHEQRSQNQNPQPRHQQSQPQMRKPVPINSHDMQQSRPNPRSGRMYPGEAPPQKSVFHQTSVELPAQLPPPPRIHDTGRPSTAPGPEKRHADPSKTTMEEWKAKERAKMHAAASRPETLPQDNAFPIFPTKRERSKVRGSQGSARGSQDFARPGTSSGHRKRPSAARIDSASNSVASSNITQQTERPPLDRNAQSFDQLAEKPSQPPSSLSPQKLPQQAQFELPTRSVNGAQPPPSLTLQNLPKPPPFEAQMRSGTGTPIHELPPWPVPEPSPEKRPSPRSAQNEWRQPSPNGGMPTPQSSELSQTRSQGHNNANPQTRKSPPVAQGQGRQPPPPPHAAASAPQYGDQAQRSYQDQSYSNQDSMAQSRQPPQRGPVPQPIDTAQAQQQRPAYMNQQPLSAGPVPTRPSTSAGHPSPRNLATMSPVSALSQPVVTPDYEKEVVAVSVPSSQQHYEKEVVAVSAPSSQQHYAKQDSLDGIYTQYGESRTTIVAPTVAQPHAVKPPMTREEEIEAEMPDFDSAAPGGTSLLHKRSQQQLKEPTASKPQAMPPVQVVENNARSFPEQVPRAYEQQQPQQQQRQISNPDQHRQQGGTTDGQVFGLPGQNGQRKYGASYNQHPPLPPQQQQSYDQYPPQPPQPPYANERPRRSMDDSRQMPYRQGAPPQQRMSPNGQPPPPRGQYPPNGRPGIDRNFSGQSVQTSWSEPPPQDRIGSAPPTRQNFRDAPGLSPSATPLSRQMSNPEQTSYDQRPNNPDTLPHHPPPAPVPVRPGHMGAGPPQSNKPPPVRNYSNKQAPSHQRQVSSSANRSGRPVTAAELDQLQAAVSANPNDHKRAFLLVKKLVEASTSLARDGRDRERYIMDADKRLKKLVHEGYPDAQFYLADCYGQGTMGLPVDPKEAFKLYQAAAKAGHPQASYRTAMCCELGPQDGGTSVDYGKAVQWYRRGAALGDPDAMFKIGIILLKGLLGQQRNVGEAVNFLKRAAETAGSENPHALFELAQLYDSGNAIPDVRSKIVPDDSYAFELFQQAGNAGHKASQFRLGQAYEYGNITAPIDNRQSITWYTKAAAQGEHQAELALSGWYLTGADGILKQSDTEAYLWARKAAASEPPLGKAMFAMGYFTETGIGCPASLEEAKKWYARAAMHKFPKAQERLDELRRNGGKSSKPVNGKLARKDQKKDEENCVVM